MKLFVQTTTALVAMATSVSAFAPVLSSSSKATTTTLMAAPNIWSTMGSLEGPSVCWGPEGVIIGHEEIEIKEYDNFNMFRSALDQCGLANELRGLGPYTLLLPTDSAVCAYNGMLDEETLRYHIIKGDIYSDELLGSLETLNPNYNLNAKQEFRKAYVDDALIGHVGQTYGTPYPTNIICENGVIHCIPTVLTPGYDPADAETQLTARRPDMDNKAGTLGTFNPIQ
ncbi:FAS1 domain-containing protein [Fragilariopsis cylindrus CCMP1102]|uniref:FAS1 domain-containing protein n=1 Tax=Fragilariopsis cylindrus CCMP1102 TaxID=635003 RepID=A0A1E7EPB6_9STRA|nr:FAS1 domain-containing protein [Fragilariopsis cylindrus CCMP1102]|eukprot:OEU07664.1 FAS1 domain-containing protein [Fragilariopsis cylindrus CCMP1102]